MTDGLFLPGGTLLALLKLVTEPFFNPREQEVSALLLTEEVVANMHS